MIKRLAATLGIFLIVSVHSFAQNPQLMPEAPDLLSPPVTASGSRIQRAHISESFTKESLGIDYSERIEAHQSARLKTFVGLALTSINEDFKRVRSDVQEVVQRAAEHCKAGGGIWQKEDKAVPERSPGDVVGNWIVYLDKNGLIGQFKCDDSAGSTNYSLVVRPTYDKQATLVPPGWDWSIELFTYTRDQFMGFIQRRIAFEESITAARANLKPGNTKQIPVTQLQTGLPETERARGKFMCALVISKNDNLVQVQVRGRQIHVPVTDLYPVRNSVTGEITESRGKAFSTCET